MVKLYLRVPYIELDPTAILSMQEPVPTVVELQPATAMTIKPAKTPVMASTSNSSSPPLLPKFMSSFSSHSSCWQHAVHLSLLPLLPHSPSHSTTPHPPPQILEEICQKNSWGQPLYTLHSTTNPGEDPLFLYKVNFLSSVSSSLPIHRVVFIFPSVSCCSSSSPLSFTLLSLPSTSPSLDPYTWSTQ